MGFIDAYLDKHRLDKMPGRIKEKLDDLEAKINEKTKQDSSLEYCMTHYGPEISDLIERVAAGIKEYDGIIDLLRFVSTIGFEVYQIIDRISDCVIPDGLTPEEEKPLKIELVADLTYFVWATIDPFGGKLGWVPFKKTIEKKVVMWLAKMAAQFAYDYFDANPDELQVHLVKSEKDKTKPAIRKAIK